VWEYGDAGARWPVRYGDVWRAGPHVLACLDIETAEAVEFYAGIDGPAVLVYSDPPWSTGNAKAFRTKAGLSHDGVTLPRLWGHILDRALPLLGYGDLVVEIGTACRDEVSLLLRLRGRPVTDMWPTRYYRKHRCWLLRSRLSIPRADVRNPTELDDEQTPAWAIEASTRPGDLVCDPCLGRGLTALAAHQLGRRFVGTELHPRRLAWALDRLARFGCVPERAGAL